MEGPETLATIHGATFNYLRCAFVRQPRWILRLCMHDSDPRVPRGNSLVANGCQRTSIILISVQGIAHVAQRSLESLIDVVSNVLRHGDQPTETTDRA